MWPWQGSAATSAGRRSSAASPTASGAARATPFCPARVRDPPLSQLHIPCGHCCALLLDDGMRFQAMSMMPRQLPGAEKQRRVPGQREAERVRGRRRRRRKAEARRGRAGKSECSRCGSATGRFCRACLSVRYGQRLEDVRAAMAAGAWLCPHCYEADNPVRAPLPPRAGRSAGVSIFAAVLHAGRLTLRG